MGEVAVALDFVANEAGDYLFVRWPKAKITPMAVLEANKLFSVGVPAPGFLPELGGVQGRQENFLGAGAAKLLPAYLLDLALRPDAKGQQGIYARCKPADHRRPHHQAMTHHLSFGGRFLEGGEKCLAETHQASPFSDTPLAEPPAAILAANASTSRTRFDLISL